ncbi:class I SAM-dependent methyltransferase [Tichowtungia aerotolerans]|uniref:Methyltransferase domain-containing protein n=1 Tax=Tichowtungia aerotolerans TaxID=2697043 RepID=A0A6P1M161_9BACT|nr:class I SAM-dependent methyltransferase [Tichowtungia aerotolerans]QHI68310.1 methyltransferase domain-containing protein [Tichowtungia aerotolerans]
MTVTVADITQTLPVPDSSVDVCFVATVLHIPGVKKHADQLFAELRRVLVDGGTAVIIECSSKDLSFGPPEAMRLSADEVEAMAARCGFVAAKRVDLGFNYLINQQLGQPGG